MERMGKIAVALTAALALAFSSVSGAVLWQLWRHPPRLNVEAAPEGLKWEGERYAAMLTVKGETLDWLMVWRRAKE